MRIDDVALSRGRAGLGERNAASAGMKSVYSVDKHHSLSIATKHFSPKSMNASPLIGLMTLMSLSA
jgi:hypothetical protein